MSYSTQNLVQNAVVTFITVKGDRRTDIVLQTFSENGATTEVELVGSMNGSNWTSIALKEMDDGVTIRSSLIGPNVAGTATVGFKYLGVRRLDATGDQCRVRIGVS